MDCTARGIDVSGKSLVVLHISGIDVAVVGLDLSLKFTEQVFRGFTQNIDQHVEPAAVSHADHNLLYTGFPGSLNQLL